MKPMTRFDNEYFFLLRQAMLAKPETDQRTGAEVHSIGSASFKFAGVPLLTLRDIDVKFACAEIVWHMNGSKGDLLEKLGYKVWGKFPRRMAYGPYWRDGGDALKGIITRLQNDPTARGCVLDSWPDAGEARSQNPCIVATHFSIVEGKLEMAVLQRSADMYFGLPHDVASFSILWHLIAAALEIKTRTATWAIGNAHIYGNQKENVYRMAKEAGMRAGETPNFALNVDRYNFLNALAGKLSQVFTLFQLLEPQYSRIKGERLPPVAIVQ